MTHDGNDLTSLNGTKVATVDGDGDVIANDVILAGSKLDLQSGNKLELVKRLFGREWRFQVATLYDRDGEKRQTKQTANRSR